MTAPTSNLNWFKWNIPRGSEFRTGCIMYGTATGYNTGLSIGVPSTSMLYIKSLEFVVESGCSWSNFYVSFPNNDGDVEGTRRLSIPTSIATGTVQMALLSDEIKEYNGAFQDKFLPSSGLTFYSYKMDLRSPIKLRYSETDTLSIQFTSLLKSVYFKASGWVIDENNAGITD